MRLSEFIANSSARIVSEWEAFARSCLPAANVMDLEQRRDHIVEMLKTIAKDLETPQSKHEQAEKSLGKDDGDAATKTAATSHGTERAASGFTHLQMVSEFRALRASVLRLWYEAQDTFDRANVEEITRFNEAIDQLLAESLTRYAQQVDAVRDLFIGVLGHDLRNPLAAIMMAATVMLSNEGPEWRHAQSARRILTSGLRIDRLIRDLLDFTRSRLDGGIPIVRREVDLETICRQVIDEIAAVQPNRVVSLKTTGSLRGLWDGERIAQVMSNLLGNAVQHGSKDEPIDVEVCGQSDQVALSVHNGGAPISKRYLADIFEPFRRADLDVAKSNGSNVGLGLYIVQSIVTAHGGTVNVESADNGTTFTVRLPR
jgi:signal transduction histidine kinase